MKKHSFKQENLSNQSNTTLNTKKDAIRCGEDLQEEEKIIRKIETKDGSNKRQKSDKVIEETVKNRPVK